MKLSFPIGFDRFTVEGAMAGAEGASGAADKIASVSLSEQNADGPPIEAASSTTPAEGPKGKSDRKGGKSKEGEKKKGAKEASQELGEYFQHRIKMFETLQKEQKEHRQQVGGQAIK